MSWLGVWRNQYGSLVKFTQVSGDRVEGVFRTALQDSGFYGCDVPLVGVTRGNCIAFASVGTGPAGDMIVSYTGLLRENRLETLWHYAADERLSPRRTNGARASKWHGGKRS